MAILHEYGIGENKKLRYNIMEYKSGINFSDMIGQRVDVAAYVIAEIADNNGEIKPVMKIKTKDGDICGTTSKAFIAGVERYLEFMETEVLEAFTIKQVASKSGRKYISFEPCED